MCRLLDWQRGARRFIRLALCVVHVFDQVRLPFEARAVSAGRRDAAPVKNASAMRANSICPIKRKRAKGIGEQPCPASRRGSRPNRVVRHDHPLHNPRGLHFRRVTIEGLTFRLVERYVLKPRAVQQTSNVWEAYAGNVVVCRWAMA